MEPRNFVDCNGAEVSVVIDGETFYFGKAEQGGWYVGRDGWFERFHSYRVAAGHFRQVVETAQLEHEAQRRMDDLAMARFRANHPVGSEWLVDSIEYNAAMGY